MPAPSRPPDPAAPPAPGPRPSAGRPQGGDGPEIIIYADGGCRGNPGVGAWAFVIINARTRDALERTGGEPHTTNNRMELLAVINALTSIRAPGHRVTVYSDSQYVIKAASEWMAGWKARGWRRSGSPLQNLDLLQALDAAAAPHRIRWCWVRGHAGNAGNLRCDQLANEAMDRMARGGSAAWEQRVVWTTPP